MNYHPKIYKLLNDYLKNLNDSLATYWNRKSELLLLFYNKGWTLELLLIVFIGKADGLKVAE